SLVRPSFHLWPKLTDFRRIENRRRTASICADKSGNLIELRIFDIGIRQLPFARVPPFDSFVNHAMSNSSPKKSARRGIILSTDNSEMERRSIELPGRQQNASHLESVVLGYRWRGKKTQGMMCHIAIV